MSWDYELGPLHFESGDEKHIEIEYSNDQITDSEYRFRGVSIEENRTMYGEYAEEDPRDYGHYEQSFPGGGSVSATRNIPKSPPDGDEYSTTDDLRAFYYTIYLQVDGDEYDNVKFDYDMSVEDSDGNTLHSTDGTREAPVTSWSGNVTVHNHLAESTEEDVLESGVEANFEISNIRDPDSDNTIEDGEYVKMFPEQLYYEYIHSANASLTVNAEDDFSSPSPDVLENDEYSSWEKLSTSDGSIPLEEGENDLVVDVDGSEEVYLEIRYSVQENPSVVEVMRISLGGGKYELPLVDPNDDQLEHDNYRFHIDEQKLCADLIDPTDEDASPYQIEIPGKGTLAWRENQE